MVEENNFPSEICQRAVETHARLLLGDIPAQAEQAEAAEHLASCTYCRQLQAELSKADQMLRETLPGPRLSPDFTARTMAALPAAQASGVRVFAKGPARRSWLRPAMAAAIVLGLLLALAAKFILVPTANELTVSGDEAVVVDEKGNRAKTLQAGKLYRAVSDAVLPLNAASAFQVKTGASFQVERSALKLKAGDVFAWARQEAQGAPVRVSCLSFDALLNGGDMFVAEEGAENAGGVVIVFRGQAQIVRDKDSLPVNAGQVFVSLDSHDGAIAQVMELNDALERMRSEPQLAQEDLDALRRDYETRVQGYGKELTQLDEQVKTEKSAERVQELRKRQALVTEYRQAHERRLKTMGRQFPDDEIERGVREHTDPETWM
ncbi:MAG TPA: hypothetical protein VGP72_18070 [Planctomycetota bacterium]|jgi:hypothetical protein